MRTLVYAYPWDIIGDPRAPERFVDLGVDAVALAASYHTARAATPFHPDHRVVDARHAACYVPVRQEIWADHLLVPATPDWTPADAFGLAASTLRAAGLPVHAWIVLTHNSRLGLAHPDLVVRNAFGDRYPYALCPSVGEVAAYCETLVREVIELGRPDGAILEACGPLGFGHGGHHEKTDGADWNPIQNSLLSLCFCASCTRRYETAGIPVEVLRAAVRTAVDGDEPPVSVEAALGDLAPAVRSVRIAIPAELRARLVGAIRELDPAVRITLHGAADPWATGPFATVADAPLEMDTLVAGCWGPPDVAVANIESLRTVSPPTVEIGAYVQTLPPTPATPDALHASLDRFGAAGATEFHLYHGGLASRARLHAIRKAVSGL